MRRFGIISEVLLWAGIVCTIVVVLTILSFPSKNSRWGFRGALTLSILSVACFVGSQVSRGRQREEDRSAASSSAKGVTAVKTPATTPPVADAIPPDAPAVLVPPVDTMPKPKDPPDKSTVPTIP